MRDERFVCMCVCLQEAGRRGGLVGDMFLPKAAGLFVETLGRSGVEALFVETFGATRKRHAFTAPSRSLITYILIYVQTISALFVDAFGATRKRHANTAPSHPLITYTHKHLQT